MREDEFPAFAAQSREGYARDLAENGGLAWEAAREKAEQDFARFLGEGVRSPGQLLFVVEEDGERRGVVWFAEQEQLGRRAAFLYDIQIDEPFRGRGLGRQAMEAFEAEVGSRGLEWIHLNVMGGNEVARRLYRSMGYAESFVAMAKRLA